jgi:CPA2 family monovalent cation:H+ antiporter-2
MEQHLLIDIIIIFGLSVVVTLIFQKIKLPTLLGYLATGVIAGPYGLSLINGRAEVDHLAEIGVILLMFIIGLEFSIKQLLSIRRAVFLGGSIQVFGTIALVALCYYFFSFDIQKSIFIGFLFSLSSTAIVLKVLGDRGEMHTPHGRIALAILIFQDILVVPMMLVTPLLGGDTDNVLLDLLNLAGKLILVLGVLFVGSRYVVPKLLYEVAKTRSQDLFILTTLLICFSVAVLCSSIGLSLALGAFLAGLIISESEYSHQATGNIIPFREIFTSFFFVSIGMLMDIGFFMNHIGIVLALTLLVIMIKTLAVGIAAFALNYPPRTMFKTGLALFQVGEFAFILSRSGIEYGLLDDEVNQYFLSISILTMALTPLLIIYSETISNYLFQLFIPRRIKTRLQHLNELRIQPTNNTNKLKNHLIIIGYGVNGRNLAKASKHAGIPYTILEMNPETVKEEQAKGEPIIYGDAIQANILEYAHIGSARSVVVAISDIRATEKILSAIRRINKTVHIIVRIHAMKEIEHFMQLGANEVIPEDFETSVEIFSRIMHKFLVSKDQINDFVNEFRTEVYDMMRPMHHEYQSSRITLPSFDIVCIKVEQDKGNIINKTLAQSHLRSLYGIQVLAIQRDKRVISHVDADTQIKLHDSLFISGDPEAIKKISEEVCL